MAVVEDSEKVTLTLDELLPDRGGDIVFEGSIDGLVVITDETVVASGVSEAHVTAAGVDVTGYCFYALESGVTLYSPVDLMVTPTPVG
jgi:hypothetical protein